MQVSKAYHFVTKDRTATTLRLTTSGFSLVLVCSVWVYLLGLVTAPLSRDHSVAIDQIFVTLGIISIALSTLHSITYFDGLLKSILFRALKAERTDIRWLISDKEPKVAVFLSVFNEDPALVTRTLNGIANISYSDFDTYLLDDSDNEKLHNELIKLVKRRDITYIRRPFRRGFKAGAINDAIEKKLDPRTKYILLVDADHRPQTGILRDLIPIMESDQNLAFVQPNHCLAHNDVPSRLEMIGSIDQRLFYRPPPAEHHRSCSVSINNVSHIWGSDTIIRLAHLKDVNGFDERSVSEDIATSFSLYLKGYKSAYVNDAYAESLPPSSLAAYFSQRQRWAYGQTQNLKLRLKAFFANPRALSATQWWTFIAWDFFEYSVSITLFLSFIYTAGTLILGLDPSYVPYKLVFLTTAAMMYCQFKQAWDEMRCSLKDFVLCKGLSMCLFPVHLHGCFFGLIGKRLSFTVTPKAKSKRQAIRPFYFLSQATIVGVVILSLLAGLWRVASGNVIEAYVWLILYSACLTPLVVSLLWLYAEDFRLSVNYCNDAQQI